MMREIKHILCAVRGGPESRHTVSQAIDLALAHSAALTFLHVVDAEFLDYALMGTLRGVYKELHEMARFAMLILQDRARRRGVQDVDYIVCEGNIRRQLREQAIAHSADVLIFGAPVRSPGSNVFSAADFEPFVAQLRREAGMQVIVAQPR